MKSKNLRIWLVFLFVLAGFLIILGRLFYLQVIRYEFFTRHSLLQQKRKITINPNRGGIYDRNHNPLAISVKAVSVYANPQEIAQSDAVVISLNRALGISRARLAKLLTVPGTFVWIKRQVPVEKIAEVKAPGIHFLPDTIRTYPGGQLAGQLIGFVGIDGKGLSGLEYAYNERLQGKSGYIVLESDLQGRTIYRQTQKVLPVNDGKSIQLSIDKHCQFFLEGALQDTVSRLKAASAMGVMMDVQTGQIWAMASVPGFDPNHYQSVEDPKVYRNNAVFKAFEPGSVMKLFTIASALENGVYSLDDQIYSPDRIVIGGKPIEEVAHAHKGPKSPTKTIREVIVKSLNVGAAQVGLKLGAERLYRTLAALEFGQATGIGLADESSGVLRPYRRWYAVDLSRISFGYGITVTTLQLAKAIASFANGGWLVQPELFMDQRPEKRKRVFSPETCQALLSAMELTVEEGTAQQTKIAGYRLGGKTGTARIYSPERQSYLIGHYNSTFAGVFPLSNPKFVLVVTVMDPSRYKYASYSAVPAFKQIARQVIRYLNMDPDRSL